MYISLFGLPGAGKSTQMHILAAQLPRGIARPRITSVKQINKYHFLLTVLKHPRFLCTLMWKTFRYYKKIKHIKQKRNAFFGCVFDFYLSYYFQTYYGRKTHFISDHGFLQVFTQSDFIRTLILQDKKHFKDFLSMIPKQNVVYVYMNLPLHIAQQRREGDGLNSNVFLESNLLFAAAAQMLEASTIDGSQDEQTVSQHLSQLVAHYI